MGLTMCKARGHAMGLIILQKAPQKSEAPLPQACRPLRIPHAAVAAAPTGGERYTLIMQDYVSVRAPTHTTLRMPAIYASSLTLQLLPHPCCLNYPPSEMLPRERLRWAEGIRSQIIAGGSPRHFRLEEEGASANGRGLWGGPRRGLGCGRRGRCRD